MKKKRRRTLRGRVLRWARAYGRAYGRSYGGGIVLVVTEHPRVSTTDWPYYVSWDIRTAESLALRGTAT